MEKNETYRFGVIPKETKLIWLKPTANARKPLKSNRERHSPPIISKDCGNGRNCRKHLPKTVAWCMQATCRALHSTESWCRLLIWTTKIEKCWNETLSLHSAIIVAILCSPSSIAYKGRRNSCWIFGERFHKGLFLARKSAISGKHEHVAVCGTPMGLCGSRL